MTFALNNGTFATIHAAEKAVEGLKGEAKENTKARNDHKITAYSALISQLAGVKLVKGNLPRAIGNQVRKALLEDSGLKDATAKRYLENSVGAMRELDIPTQATPELVKDILLSENIDSENKLAKRVSGEAEKDPMRDLAETLIGKFSTRKDDDGNRVKGIFKPSKFDEADWDRFDDIVRELRAARTEGSKAAAASADEVERQNNLANAVFAQM
jgi:hypothetical protein